MGEVIPYVHFNIGSSSYYRRKDKRVEKSTGIAKDYQPKTVYANRERYK